MCGLYGEGIHKSTFLTFMFLFWTLVNHLDSYHWIKSSLEDDTGFADLIDLWTLSWVCLFFASFKKCNYIIVIFDILSTISLSFFLYLCFFDIDTIFFEKHTSLLFELWVNIPHSQHDSQEVFFRRTVFNLQPI